MVTATNCKWLLERTPSQLYVQFTVYVQNSVRIDTAQQIIII